MFQNPRAPYTTSNNFTNFTPNFYTRPYILSHVVPMFFASAPPEIRGLSVVVTHYGFPFSTIYNVHKTNLLVMTTIHMSVQVHLQMTRHAHASNW